MLGNILNGVKKSRFLTETNIWLWHLLDRPVSSTFRRWSTGYRTDATSDSLDQQTPSRRSRVSESCLWHKATKLPRKQKKTKI